MSGHTKQPSKVPKSQANVRLRIVLPFPLVAHVARPLRRFARQDVVPVRSWQFRESRSPRVHCTQLPEAQRDLRRDELELKYREALPLAHCAPCNNEKKETRHDVSVCHCKIESRSRDSSDAAASTRRARGSDRNESGTRYVPAPMPTYEYGALRSTSFRAGSHRHGSL